MAAKTPKTELTEDIIFNEILPRIPAKSLVKRKCVSRQWYSLISSPEFAKTHLHHPSSLSSRSVLTLNYCSSFVTLDYSDSNNLVYDQFDVNLDGENPFIWLCASCNGLALLISSPIECEYPELDPPDNIHFFDFQYVVFNPALGVDSFVEIPHPKEFVLATAKGTDHYYNFGFGYSSSDNDYYIVAIRLPMTPVSPEVVVYVYSLRSQHWQLPRKFKQMRLPLEFQDPWYNVIATLVEETLHWGVTLGSGHKCIATFDLGTKNDIGFIQLPKAEFGVAQIGGSAFCLCCMDGCLCAFAKYEDGNVVEMWMLKEYKVHDSWTKLFRFNPDYYCRSFFGFTESKMGLIFAADTDELMLADFTSDPPKYKSIKFAQQCQAVDYVQSLVSPLPA